MCHKNKMVVSKQTHLLFFFSNSLFYLITKPPRFCFSWTQMGDFAFDFKGSHGSEWFIASVNGITP